jgi:hypothetical protein
MGMLMSVAACNVVEPQEGQARTSVSELSGDCTCRGETSEGKFLEVECGYQVCGPFGQLQYCAASNYWELTGTSCPVDINSCACGPYTTSQGSQIGMEACGHTFCGTDGQYWTCMDTDWMATGFSCGEACDCQGIDDNGLMVYVPCGDQICGNDGRRHTCLGEQVWSAAGQFCGSGLGGACACSWTDSDGMAVTIGCGETVCGTGNVSYGCIGEEQLSYLGESCQGSCTCTGTDVNGYPVTAPCGESVCGQGNIQYACIDNGVWQELPQSCGMGGCACRGVNHLGQEIWALCGDRVCGLDQQYYDCVADMTWQTPGLSCGWQAACAPEYGTCDVGGALGDSTCGRNGKRLDCVQSTNGVDAEWSPQVHDTCKPCECNLSDLQDSTCRGYFHVVGTPPAGSPLNGDGNPAQPHPLTTATVNVLTKAKVLQFDFSLSAYALTDDVDIPARAHVGIWGVDSAMGWALVSPWGHVARLSDLTLDGGDPTGGDQPYVDTDDLVSAWTGQTRYEAVTWRLDAAGVMALETVATGVARSPGVRSLPIYGMGYYASGGSWFGMASIAAQMRWVDVRYLDVPAWSPPFDARDDIMMQAVFLGAPTGAWTPGGCGATAGFTGGAGVKLNAYTIMTAKHLSLAKMGTPGAADSCVMLEPSIRASCLLQAQRCNDIVDIIPHPDVDLALVKVSTPLPGPYATLRAAYAAAGEGLWFGRYTGLNRFDFSDSGTVLTLSGEHNTSCLLAGNHPWPASTSIEAQPGISASGDSGGPVFIGDEVVGVVHGEKCLDPWETGDPRSIFVHTPALRSWILSHL